MLQSEVQNPSVMKAMNLQAQASWLLLIVQEPQMKVTVLIHLAKELVNPPVGQEGDTLEIANGTLVVEVVRGLLEVQEGHYLVADSGVMDVYLVVLGMGDHLFVVLVVGLAVVEEEVLEHLL